MMEKNKINVVIKPCYGIYYLIFVDQSFIIENNNNSFSNRITDTSQ